MSDWWYVRDDERVGPVSIEKLKGLLQRGLISGTTMVWQQDMPAWLPLQEVDSLNSIKQVVPPPVPRKPEAERLLDLPLANRWPRFLARLFDLWGETLLLALLAGIVLGHYSASFLEWINRPGSGQIFGILCVPFALLLDAVVYAIFGNTVGKALLGLSVTTLRGERLRLSQYARRNMAIWVAGLGLGVPVVTLFTTAWQGTRLNKGQQATYDESTGFRVHAKPLKLFRRAFFGLMFCALFILMAVLNNMGQEMERESIATSQQKFYVWENPITKANSSIDAKWKFSTRANDDGQQVYMFAEQADHAAVIFAAESPPGFSLSDYVQAFQKNTASQMQFNDGGKFSEENGRPTWQGNGVFVESLDSRLQVRVVQFKSTFWRVVTIQTPPYGYSDDMVKVLEKALWESVSTSRDQLAP